MSNSLYISCFKFCFESWKPLDRFSTSDILFSKGWGKKNSGFPLLYHYKYQIEVVDKELKQIFY